MLHAPTEELPAALSDRSDVIPGTRYKLLEKLGHGGMGTVYAAEHVDIERKVALKILHADLLRNPGVLRQFREEARAASKIGNPYICDVTDWGELHDGRVFFVMEYLDGPSLAKVLKKKRRMTSARCLPILRQVAKALGAAHDKGIVHLDVKPDNVLLVEREGRADAVKVVDFGVAGLLGQEHGQSLALAGRMSDAKVMGTPEYMAPERATGSGYDHRSDIYSLGVMAYEMLAGEVPFHGPTAIDTLAQQASEPADRINERLTSPVPLPIEAVVMTMLEKHPARRPQSMAEVEALLLEAQIEARVRTPWDDLPLPAVAQERMERIARRMQRPARRMRAFAVGAAVAAAVGAGSSVYFMSRQPTVVIRERPPVVPSRPEVHPLSVLPVAAAVPAPAAPPAPAVARARDPEASREAAARGLAALAAGRIEQAGTELEQAVADDPRNAVATGGLAEVAFESARYREAVRLAERAARLAPRSAKHLLLLGDASFKLSRYEDALRAYRRAEAIAPDDDAVRAGLDRVRAKLGK